MDGLDAGRAGTAASANAAIAELAERPVATPDEPSQPRPRRRLAARPPAAVVAADARGLWPLPLMVITLGLFCLSGGLLWDLGYNYDGLTGSALTKLHPMTYLAVLAFAGYAIADGNPVRYAVQRAQKRPGAALMLAAALALLMHIVTHSKNNMGGAVDTFLIPALLAMMLADTDARGLRRLAWIVHGMMTVNALMALFEFVTDHRYFPFRLDGMAFPFDTRSSALQGHPLENAAITGCYVMMLLSGSTALSAGLRLVMVGLQLAALVTFGGRSALVLTLLLSPVYMLGVFHRVMRSGRVPLLNAAVTLMLAGLVPLVIALLWQRGFFDALITRFNDDGGSAHARVAMFALFEHVPFRDLLVGPDISSIDSVRRVNGLEWGIENPIVKTLLYQGLLMTMLLAVALVLFLRDIARRCGPGVWLPLLSFAILINTSESISGKTSVISKFVIMLLCLYPRPAPVARTEAAGTAPETRS